MFSFMFSSKIFLNSSGVTSSILNPNIFKASNMSLLGISLSFTAWNTIDSFGVLARVRVAFAT